MADDRASTVWRSRSEIELMRENARAISWRICSARSTSAAIVGVTFACVRPTEEVSHLGLYETFDDLHLLLASGEVRIHDRAQIVDVAERHPSDVAYVRCKVTWHRCRPRAAAVTAGWPWRSRPGRASRCALARRCSSRRCRTR